MSAQINTARQMGLRPCHVCGHVHRISDERRYGSSAPTRCPRCQTQLHVRKHDSLSRAWAFVLAAAILYIPANVLPILQTHKLLQTRDDTILSGIAELWHGGAWDLALIVFIASIVVPLVKIISLLFLLISVQLGSSWHPEARTRLYRMIDFIGHWSMLDIFVVSLLAALVQFGPFAHAQPESGAVAFGAVVVLTMLATMSFDPRLIWDAVPADTIAGPATGSGNDD